MDNSPAYIIKEYLVDQGDLTAFDASAGSWKVYMQNLPDGKEVDHDSVVCIDTAPFKDGRIMGGSPLFHFGVQILLRATEYDDGYAKASDLALALDAVDDATVNIGSDVYTINNVSQTTGVVRIGQEEGTKRREMFSVNFLATIQEES